ncbi:MAG: hypothetical protein GYB65_02320 [Chloroflexi bacterium]|nr:hypothetical protein [Chloroflexota bacterium]
MKYNEFTPDKGDRNQHAPVRAVLVITPDKMVPMAAEELRDAMFGNVSISVFDTVEQALLNARSN